MYYIDIDQLSNGLGKEAYGGRLEAYSFIDTSCKQWFEQFTADIISAIGKKYYPVYRIADGELRFLFGAKINWHNKTLKSILSYIKYEIFKTPWKTSWGEEYNTNELNKLKITLQKYISVIAKEGKLALYWNQNGLNAFTEYNQAMQFLFARINTRLNERNYIPFHFGPALIAKNTEFLIKDKNILFVSGLSEKEFVNLKKNIITLGAKNVSLHKCSSSSSLLEDYTNVLPVVRPDIILVAAGIGAAKVLVELSHLKCPVIDIGGYIHVLSGKLTSVHGGFFVAPTNLTKIIK